MRRTRTVVQMKAVEMTGREFACSRMGALVGAGVDGLEEAAIGKRMIPGADMEREE